MSSTRTGGASGASVVSQDCPKLRGKALRPAPRFRDDSAVRVRWAGLNLVNEGADGALILYICWERQAVGVAPVCCLKAWAKAAC